MKKTIAMLLAGMLTVSCGIVSASAADTGTSQSAQKTITIATWANTYTSVNNMRTDIYNGIKDNTLDLYKPNEGEYEILRIKYPY